MNTNLNHELDFMDTFAEENPKNYQIWYHRRVIVERLGNPSRELGNSADNYHSMSGDLTSAISLAAMT